MNPPLQARARNAAGVIPLALFLAFCSAGLVQKFGGTGGLLAYTAAVAAACVVARCCQPLARRLIAVRFRAATAACVILLGVSYVISHPLEDGKGPGRSSDRDEGLELAVGRMLNGENPYYPQNPVAGPLSLLPGAILLATPFVCAGSVGLQNVFWLGAFLVACRRRFADPALALTLTVLPLAISPSCLYEFVSGGDLIANGIYVTLALMAAGDVWSRPVVSRLPAAASLLFLATALASRANFILLLPVFGAFVWSQRGLPRAIAACATTLALSAAIVLPFYAVDPAAFTPLMSRDKLSFADKTLPWAGPALMALTVCAASTAAIMVLRERRERREPDATGDWLRGCALVTLTPMVGAVLIASVLRGAPDFSFLHARFGLMYLFTVLVGWGAALSPAAAPGAASAGTAPTP